MSPHPLAGDKSPISYPNQTKRLIGSSVALIALSTTFVLLRLVSRKLSKAGFWVRFTTFAQDWMIADLRQSGMMC